MANEVKLPRLGQGMEAGTVNKWLKSEGDTVAKGEPLFEVDTDKVTQEVESDFAGVLLKIVLPSGEAPVGQTIAYIGEAGEEVKAQEEAPAPKAEPDSAQPNQIREVPAEPAAAPASSNGGRIKASPLARRIARERGIDLRALQGTGPEGRIIAEDVERGAVGRTGGAGRRPDGRDRVRAADEHSQDDRPPPHSRVGGAGLPADGERRHDARERARRGRARAEPGRPRHGHRPARRRSARTR